MGILVPLVFVVIVGIIWPKGNHAAHLAGIGGVLFGIWALIAVASPHAAATVAAGAANGISEFAHALGAFVTKLAAAPKK